MQIEAYGLRASKSGESTDPAEEANCNFCRVIQSVSTRIGCVIALNLLVIAHWLVLLACQSAGKCLLGVGISNCGPDQWLSTDEHWQIHVKVLRRRLRCSTWNKGTGGCLPYTVSRGAILRMFASSGTVLASHSMRFYSFIICKRLRIDPT
jgi:hypothetical protein